MATASVDARRHQLDKLLDPWGPQEVMWVKDHCLIKAQKVYLNYYDLLQPHSNCILSWLGLGGAYHAGVEILGQEYAFGGHYSEEYGIFSTKPLFQQRTDLEDKVQSSTDVEEREDISQHLQTIPQLHSRTVIGWWRGSHSKFEELLRLMKEQQHWSAPTYRLLTRNCNHFVQDLCQHLLDHECFHPLPGCSTVQDLVPSRLTRLTDFALCCCPSFLSSSIDAPMLHAPYEMDIFQGKAERVGASPGLEVSAAAARAAHVRRGERASTRRNATRTQHSSARRMVIATAGNIDDPREAVPMLGRNGPVVFPQTPDSSGSSAMGFGGSAKISITPSQRLAQQSTHHHVVSPQMMRRGPGPESRMAERIASAADIALEAHVTEVRLERAAEASMLSRSLEVSTPTAHQKNQRPGKAVQFDGQQHLIVDNTLSSPMGITTPQRPEEQWKNYSPVPSPNAHAGTQLAEATSPYSDDGQWRGPTDRPDGRSSPQGEQAMSAFRSQSRSTDPGPHPGSTFTRLPRRTSLPPLHRKHLPAESTSGSSSPVEFMQQVQPTSPTVEEMTRPEKDVLTANSRMLNSNVKGPGSGLEGGDVGRSGQDQRRLSMMEMVMETLQEAAFTPGVNRKSAAQQENNSYGAKSEIRVLGAHPESPVPRTPPAVESFPR